MPPRTLGDLRLLRRGAEISAAGEVRDARLARARAGARDKTRAKRLFRRKAILSGRPTIEKACAEADG